MTGNNPEWESVSDLGIIELPSKGIGLIVVGIEGCKPCDIVGELVTAFIAKHSAAIARFYKLSANAQMATNKQLFGEELRFYPTVVGTVDGVIAFRMKGASPNISTSDVATLERKFRNHTVKDTSLPQYCK